MKSNGIFKIRAALMALSRNLKMLFTTPSKAIGGNGRISNGRSAFYGISAPKCHNQKKRWF